MVCCSFLTLYPFAVCIYWLLTKGSQVIIEEFELVSTVHEDHKSRSMGGFMLKTRRGDFRVPPAFAGIHGDNFITKALISNQPIIRRIVREEVKRVF